MSDESRYDVKINMNEEDTSHTKCINMIRDNKKILEFGCAKGFVSEYLQNVKNCEVYAVEYDEEFAKIAKDKCKEVLVGDIETLEWKEKFKGIEFDYVLCMDILEHIRNPKRILEEIYDFVGDNTEVIISVPNIANNAIIMELIDNNFKYSNSGLLDETHIFHFTYNTLCKMLEDVGFILYELDATYHHPATTEFMKEYNSKNIDLISKQYGSVYQFIVKAGKDNTRTTVDKIENANISTYSMQIFYSDTGKYSEEESMVQPIKILDNIFECIFCVEDIKTKIVNLRIDPINTYLFANRISVQLMYEDGSYYNLKHTSTNGEILENDSIYFETIDPQLYYDLNSIDLMSVRFIKVLVSFKEIDTNVLERNTQLFKEVSNRNKYIDTIQGELTNVKDELVSTKDELVSTKDELVSTKDELVSTKDELVITKDDLISTKDDLVSVEYELVNTKHELVSKKSELSNAYENIEIINQLNMELTAQARGVESIANFIRKLIMPLYFLFIPIAFIKRLIRRTLNTQYNEKYETYKKHAEFDTNYYLEQEKSVFVNKFNALDNYIMHGYKQHYNPNRYFSVDEYLAQNEDVNVEGIDAYYHFLKYGIEEGRNTSNLIKSVKPEQNILKKVKWCKYLFENNLYDYQYYMTQYSDDVLSRVNNNKINKLLVGPFRVLKKILLHPVYDYVFYGVYINRDLVSSFSSYDYLDNNRDILLQGINPFYHYCKCGKSEGRIISKNKNTDITGIILNYSETDFSNIAKYENQKADYKIDIIVPVYNGCEYLDILFGSIIENTTVDYKLIIIEDCSPDENVKSKIAQWLPRFDEVEYIENEANKGFVKSVNIASKYTTNDFVILNTDTSVPKNWAERLMKPMKEGENVASVTPFSNSATYLSFPNTCKDNTINQKEATMIDNIFSNFTYSVDEDKFNIPTGVGFCMAVNKELWVKLGGFDEEKFGLGYGEEVDFCQRAIKNGYVNKFVPNLFVYHFHGGSFESDKRKRRIEDAGKTISGLYPSYDSDVQNTILKSPMKEFTDVALIRYIKASNAVLIFDHGAGGGAMDYLYNSYAVELESQDKVYAIITPKNKVTEQYNVVLYALNNKFNISFDNLNDVFECFGTEVVINELVFWDKEDMYFILETLADNKYINTFMFHDFYAVCPSYNLLTNKSAYCNNSDIEKCKKCVEDNQYCSVKDVDITKWRTEWQSFISNANIRFYSESIYEIAKKYYEFDDAKVEIIPHKPLIEFEPVIVQNNEKLVIGTIGALNIQKGVEIVLDMAEYIDKHNIDVEIVVVGDVSPEYKSELENYKCTKILGRYKRNELPKIIKENNINVINIPSIWPETFCYTLQECMQMHMPVVAFYIGAQGERTKEYAKGIVVKEITAEGILKATNALFTSVYKQGKNT